MQWPMIAFMLTQGTNIYSLQLLNQSLGEQRLKVY